MEQNICLGRKPKVIFIVPTLDPGGIETYLLRFLKFNQEKIEPYIFVRCMHKGKLFDEYSRITNNIYYQPQGYVNPLNLVKYYRLFKVIQPVTVVDFNANFSGLTMLVAMLSGIDNRISFYRQGSDHFKASLLKSLYDNLANKLVYKYSSSILSNSQAAIDFFFPYRKRIDPRFEVIPNGINISDYEFNESGQDIKETINVPKDKYIIGHVGRLDPAKNHPMILDIAERLLTAKQNVHFVLCGLGTEQLRARLKERGLSDNFSILGYRSDVPRILKTFDMFLFPSWTEGQPNALIEAMALGVRIVASDISSIKECMPKAYNSFLIKPDDTAGFVKAIDDIIQFDNYNTAGLRAFAARSYNMETNFMLFMKKLLALSQSGK